MPFRSLRDFIARLERENTLLERRVTELERELAAHVAETKASAAAVEALAARSSVHDELVSRIAELEEEFIGNVFGLFVEHERDGHELEGFAEPRAERLGEIGHLIPGADAFFVEPIEDLFRTKNRLASLAQASGEGIEGFTGERRLGGRVKHTSEAE